MKRACLAVLMCWLLPNAASAAPCIPGSLADYIALGGSGCSVGTALFSNFTSLPLQGGATQIADAATLVNPVGVALQPGLRFDVNSQAVASEFLQLVIGYSVSGASFIGNQNSLTGSVVTPDGAVTATETKCLGQVFVLGSCSGTQVSSVAFDLGFTSSLAESLSFAPTTLIGVVVDIAVDGGPFGSASLGFRGRRRSSPWSRSRRCSRFSASALPA